MAKRGISPAADFVSRHHGLTATEMAELAVDELARDVQVELLAMALQTIERNEVRQIEQAEFRQRYSARSFAGVNTAVGWSSKLLIEPVALYDGVRHTWGELTIEQHEFRIARLQVHVAGIEDTIGRHRWAIDEITAAGVNCLNDLAKSAA
jgi:hypothetical protein